MYLLLIADTHPQYKTIFLILLIVLFQADFISKTIALSEILLSMEKHKIVPDVIDSLPTQLAEINYSGKLKVTAGTELTPTQAKSPPSVSWSATDPDSYYTLAMIDPDAPSRTNPKFREWAHWLVVNIPGNDIKRGEPLIDYVGAAPPKDTGLHRYVFVVYKQPSKLQFSEKKIPNTSGGGRKSFSIRQFAAKYNLNEPIAANLFQAKYDAYCAIIYKQLSS